MTRLKNAIGLFGTVGRSRWRDPVVARLEREAIPYFNPVVDAAEWTPAHAPLEAEHLATDKVVLFAITAEEESFGSLAETGWAALSARRNGQTAVFAIEDYPGGPNTAPNRARALVRAHAQRAGVPIYDTVDAAVQAAIAAFRA